MGSLTCATILIHATHANARQALPILHKTISDKIDSRHFDSAQVLTRKLKTVLHPTASRNQNLATEFTVQCFSQPTTNSNDLSHCCDILRNQADSNVYSVILCDVLGHTVWDMQFFSFFFFFFSHEKIMGESSTKHSSLALFFFSFFLVAIISNALVPLFRSKISPQWHIELRRL